MKNAKVYLGLSCVLIITSCTLRTTFLETPLTTEEKRFIGTWTHVEGIGNSWSKEFSEDRELHTSSDNLIFGTNDNYYIWEADGSNLYIYDSYSLFLRDYETWDYSFIDTETVVIDGDEYSLE